MTTDTKAPSLLPCPFCGEPPEVTETGWTAIIHCDNESCGCDVEAIGTERHVVVEAWNTRATPPAPTPSAARERIALGDIVRTSEHSPYFSDWRGATMKVVGLHLAPDGATWADVIEGEQRHRGNGRYDGETTDIDTTHLDVIERSALLPDAAAIRAAAFEEAAKIARRYEDSPWPNAGRTAREIAAAIRNAGGQ